MNDNKKNEVTEQDVKLPADELSEVSGGVRFTNSGEHDLEYGPNPNDAPNVTPGTEQETDITKTLGNPLGIRIT